LFERELDGLATIHRGIEDIAVSESAVVVNSDCGVGSRLERKKETNELRREENDNNQRSNGKTILKNSIRFKEI
jgi:hypothetical protein